MRKTNHSTAARFFEDKGFYIILFLCVAAIGVSGYVLFSTPQAARTEPLSTAVYEPTVTQTDFAPVLAGENDMPIQPEIPVVAEPVVPPAAEVAAEPAEPVAQVVAPIEPVYIRPTVGKVFRAYSGDSLVYIETMGDWRTHAGIDYASQSGDRVYAMTDGTVDSVYNDPRYGSCVVLSHADELVTTYMGLSDSVKVVGGDTVKAGDIIGTVGSGNLAESQDGTCLHVEATRGGNPVDPASIAE